MRLSSHRLRWSLVFAATACVLLLAFTGSVAATDPITFTLINGTDYTIMEFYASPPSTDSWEEDILGRDVLEPGEAVDITIDDWREDCLYDFLAVFDDDTELVHERVSVCDGEEYTYE